MRKLLTLIKNNFITALCFVLSAVMLFSAVAVTYAKYLESEATDATEGTVGPAAFSAKIDGVSALSFTNTAFWGGTVAEDKVAMNALRSINFSISNFETIDGIEQVNTVKNAYQLTFTAPKNFTEKLAIQVIDSADASVIPQIVLSDVLKGTDFNTADSEDYTATEATDLALKVTNTGGVYTAKTADGSVVITLTPTTKTVTQTLYFRLWDTSKLTSSTNPVVENEGGDLLAPVCITVTDEVECYAISVDLPDRFVLPAGVKTTHEYAMRLAPTSTLSDEHLGGVLMTKNADNSYTVAETLYRGQSLYMVTTEENIVDDDAYATSAPDGGWHTILGNVKKYSEGQTTTVELDPETTLQGPFFNDGTPTTNNSTVTTYDIVYYDSDGNVVQTLTEQDSIPTTRPTNATSRVVTQIQRRNATTTVDTTVSTLTKTEAKETILTEDISNDGNTIKQIVTKDYTVTTTTTTNSTTTIVAEKRVRQRTDTYISSYGGYWSNGSYGSGNWTDTTEVFDDVDEDTTYTTPQETFYRTIFRRQSSIDVKIETASRVKGTYREDDGEGNITVVDIVESYYQNADKTDDATTDVIETGPFNIMATIDGVERQVYFLSQCYSKNYPMTVHVDFKQIN